MVQVSINETFNWIKKKKYDEGCGFFSFARKKSGDNFGKKLMDAAIKTEIDAANTASKELLKKQQKLLEI